MLTRLFRPEFVRCVHCSSRAQHVTRDDGGPLVFRAIHLPDPLSRTRPVPVSPDAFSAFGQPDRKQHNSMVVRATTMLLTEACSEAIVHLLVRPVLDGRELSEALHQRGINLFLLGHLHRRLQQLELQQSEHSRERTASLKLRIRIEMVARAAKSILLQRIRKLSLEVDVVMAHLYPCAACEFFNELLRALCVRTRPLS
jgi:hypothetical protein